jgi:hypothetical protein
MPRQRASTAIDLAGWEPGPGVEVVELAAEPAPSPPPRPFAALDDLPEPDYDTGRRDGTGSAGLWRAIGSL